MIKNQILRNLNQNIKNIYSKSHTRKIPNGYQIAIERKDGGANIYNVEGMQIQNLLPSQYGFYEKIFSEDDRNKLVGDLSDIFLMIHLSKEKSFKEEGERKFANFSIENRTEYLKTLKSIALTLKKYNVQIKDIQHAIPLALARTQEHIDNKEDMCSYYDSVAFMVLDDTVDCIDFENDFDNI